MEFYEGCLLVMWKDLNRPMLEIEAPYKFEQGLACFDIRVYNDEHAMAEHESYRQITIPIKAVSYIDQNFG